MSQPEAIQDTSETASIDGSVIGSSILDPATVTLPADCGLNLSADMPEVASQKPQTRRSSTPPAKLTRPSLFGLLRSYKVRMLLTVASLSLIIGLIGLNVNRLPIIVDSEADSESLDLSEMGESTADVPTLDSPAEPRRHKFDAQFEDHPLMRNASLPRLTSDRSAESDWPTTDSRSEIVPITNFTDGPLPATASQPRRASVSGVQGAWLTGQIESDDSLMTPAMERNVSVNQAAPQRLPRARHPLAD